MEKRFTFYWMAKTDTWYLLPSLHITIEEVGTRKVIGVEIIWLKRWCAFEIDLLNLNN